MPRRSRVQLVITIYHSAGFSAVCACAIGGLSSLAGRHYTGLELTSQSSLWKKPILEQLSTSAIDIARHLSSRLRRHLQSVNSAPRISALLGYSQNLSCRNLGPMAAPVGLDPRTIWPKFLSKITKPMVIVHCHTTKCGLQETLSDLPKGDGNVCDTARLGWLSAFDLDTPGCIVCAS